MIKIFLLHLFLAKDFYCREQIGFLFRQYTGCAPPIAVTSTPTDRLKITAGAWYWKLLLSQPTVENFRFSGNWKYLRQKRGLALHHPVLLLCVQITKEKLHLITCLSENGLDRNRINQENMSIATKNIFRYKMCPYPQKLSKKHIFFSTSFAHLNPWLN